MSPPLNPQWAVHRTPSTQIRCGKIVGLRYTLPLRTVPDPFPTVTRSVKYGPLGYGCIITLKATTASISDGLPYLPYIALRVSVVGVSWISTIACCGTVGDISVSEYRHYSDT